MQSPFRRPSPGFSDRDLARRIFTTAQGQILSHIDAWARFSPESEAAFAALKAGIASMKDPAERVEMQLAYDALELAANEQVRRIRADLTAIATEAFRT